MRDCSENGHRDNDSRLSQSEPAPRWRQYFNAKVAKEGTFSRKRNSTGDTKAIRRIYPEEKCQATLIMAREIVTPPGVEVDDALSPDDESMFFGSRPVTPSAGRAFLSSPPPATLSLDGPAIESKSRRSFSVGDLLATGPQLFRLPRSSKRPVSKPVRKGGVRATSAPLPLMGNGNSVVAHGELEPPAKRRDITDPTLYRRDIHTPHGEQTHGTGRGGQTRQAISSTLPDARLSKCVDSPAVGSSPAWLQEEARSTSPRIPDSSMSAQPLFRPSRHSLVPSDGAITLVRPNNYVHDTRSKDMSGNGLSDDAAEEPPRTVVNRSSSGMRGPHIETIFDESPPHVIKNKVTTLRDLLPNGTFWDQIHDFHEDITEENESISTPARPLKTNHVWNLSAAAQDRESSAIRADAMASPQNLPKLPNFALAWDPLAEEDEGWWSSDEEQHRSSLATGHDTEIPYTSPVQHPEHHLQLPSSSSVNVTPYRLSTDQSERDTKSNIFDWSEQQPMKSPGNRSPPRPKTVHGKKDAEDRGSRSAGRRAPSAVHARSQSVPVVPDLDGKREVGANKFGTWGVGSKGVTEDWNEDFDFPDTQENTGQDDDGEERRVDSGLSMVVPQMIKEQQVNVLANIGMVREWGLIIEELKVLKIRAAALDKLGGQHTNLWKEVDAMIELADQEVEEHTIAPSRSPPSSPGFDFDAFDEPSTQAIVNSRAARKQTLPVNDDILINGSVIRTPKGTPKSTTNRPRKDSQAVAMSVIEALQQKRTASDPELPDQNEQPSDKVPFDTGTLRHIVPHVNNLLRRVKEVLREAEGLYTSPDRTARPENDPPFSHIFRELPESPSSRRKLRRSRATTDHTTAEDAFQTKGDELASHMKLMTVM
ncbi:hypothetical protein B0A49_04542 [Cryomyces minteri]|uniref:Uncharacterized protein n=2 Tax=Cryomyces minteri TaxID=331657 RepID=A0A4U0X959_9PEZI|nr:hypothetical protein B0A49_04542 [Cryomyces minteri]